MAPAGSMQSPARTTAAGERPAAATSTAGSASGRARTGLRLLAVVLGDRRLHLLTQGRRLASGRPDQYRQRGAHTEDAGLAAVGILRRAATTRAGTVRVSWELNLLCRPRGRWRVARGASLQMVNEFTRPDAASAVHRLAACTTTPSASLKISNSSAIACERLDRPSVRSSTR